MHENNTDEILKRIVPHILLNSSFVPDLGIFHGKMGIVLFFAHYGRYTGNSLYDDFAGKLLDEIYEDLPNDLPATLESGLCGIGWGIEYLVQNKFMEGDTDEILKDIDCRIMERDPRRIKDMSFRNGLGGIIFYVTARLNKKRNKGNSPFDISYLTELQKALKGAEFVDNDNIPSSLVEIFQNRLSEDSSVYTILTIPALLFSKTPQETEDIAVLPLGIYEGLSGMGLKQMGI